MLNIKLVDVLAIAATSAMLTLAFPGSSYPGLAWIALIPFFLLIFRSSYLKAGLSAFIVGFIFFVSFMGWTLKLNELDLFHFCVLGVYLALFFCLFGPLAKYFHSHFPALDIVTLPSIWVALEYLKSNIGFMSFTSGILGYSQYQILPVAGIASYTGVYGVSFAIVAVNAALATIFWRLVPHRAVRAEQSLTAAPTLYVPCSFLLVLLAIFCVINFMPGKPDAGSRSIKVALIQGNAVVTEKHEYEKYMREVFPIYEGLTAQAMTDGPELIIWPSAAVPGVIPFDRNMVSRVGEVALKNKVYLLVGAAGLDKFDTEHVRTQRVANSAFLFSPEGKITDRYDKVRLLPFEEYLPLREYIPWPTWVVDTDLKDLFPGKELTLFVAGQARFGVQICYENMFPNQTRQLVFDGADFVVGQTNDIWTHSETAQYQFLAYYVFRAIENGVPIARTSTNGISCAIDSNGRIVTSVKNQDGREVNVAGFSVANLNIGGAKSFYNHFGDIFSWVCQGFIALLGLAGLFKI